MYCKTCFINLRGAEDGECGGCGALFDAGNRGSYLVSRPRWIERLPGVIKWMMWVNMAGFVVFVLISMLIQSVFGDLQVDHIEPLEGYLRMAVAGVMGLLIVGSCLVGFVAMVICKLNRIKIHIYQTVWFSGEFILLVLLILQLMGKIY